MLFFNSTTCQPLMKQILGLYTVKAFLLFYHYHIIFNENWYGIKRNKTSKSIVTCVIFYKHLNLQAGKANLLKCNFELFVDTKKWQLVV